MNKPNEEVKIKEKRNPNKSKNIKRRQETRLKNKPLRTNLKTKYTSHSFYNNLWAEAQVHLRQILKEERAPAIPSTTRKQIFSISSQVFFKYLTMYKKLEQVYDQMAHPQKRLLVRKLLDLAIVRLLEIRATLVSTENSEFFYLDELSYIEKIPPSDLEVPIPKFYYHDPPESTICRDSWYKNIQERKAKAESDALEMQKRIQAKLFHQDSKWDSKGEKEEEESAYADQASLIIIQTMERARQGLVRYKLGKYLHEEEAREVSRKARLKKKRMDPERAALVIQRVTRGFIARARVTRMRQEELELLGLCRTYPNEHSLQGRAQLKCKREEIELEKAREMMRLTRRWNEKLFEEAKVTITNKLRLLEAPDMAEKFKFQIRSWILDVKETSGKLPDIPKAEFGGSKLLICPNALSNETREKGKKEEESKKSKKDRKKEKAKKETGKKGKVPELLSNPKLQPPNYLQEMISANVEYNKVWRGRDESHNPEQKHEEKYIIHEKRALIGEEVREQVDIALKAELLLLRQALEKKGKGKKKKGKGKRGKSKKGKKGRKKKKKGKDMTPDRTTESLFQELYENGIIKQYPHTRIDSLVGNCSLINGEIRSFFSENNIKNEQQSTMPLDPNPQPSFGDVKRVVKDICILPMGSKGVHSMAPHVKSVLICGPEGSGKKALVNSICTELRATLFDLTAANIAGKYPGKPGLKMLMHLIDKVGHAVAPVIIKINECEKTYAKKVAKTDKSEPKRLKKQLGKLLKTFVPGDQILLIGLSSEPYSCAFKLLKKDYQKIIYIPRPNYSTRLDVWTHFLLPHKGFLDKDVHFSLLAKLSDGWTAGIIKKVATFVVNDFKKVLEREEIEKNRDEQEAFFESKKVCSVKKLIRMDKFLEELSGYDPVFLEQEKAWNSWFAKTPLMRLRILSQLGDVTLKKDKKKKKGKKKK